MPSIIRPTGTDEIWTEEGVLPSAHDLSIYAVAWSKRTGLLASVGADGRIVVYQEQFANEQQGSLAGEAMDTGEGSTASPSTLQTEWSIIATLEGAHGIYEINHVAWAKRADRGRDEGKYEEILVTTADDGSIKVWTLGL